MFLGTLYCEFVATLHEGMKYIVTMKKCKLLTYAVILITESDMAQALGNTLCGKDF